MDRVKINLPNGGVRVCQNGVRLEVKPGMSYELEGEGIDVELCTGNFKQTTPSAELIPFDLEAAKAGAPLVTRDGRKVHFVAHDPGADVNFRLLVRFGDSVCATAVHESGSSQVKERHGDIFMAPKPKRTVWVNLYIDGSYSSAGSAADALRFSKMHDENSHVAIAVPIEIDA